MRNRILPTLGLFTTLFAPLVIAGCSLHADEPAALTDVGSVGVALQLAPGVTLDTATYTVTRTGGFTKTGTLNLSQSSTLAATIGGLPAGAGYSISITGSATGGFACSGSATFAIVGGMTSTAVIGIECRGTSQNGTLDVKGTISLCPVIDELTVSPAEVRVGGSMALLAAAHDRDAQPLTYHWAAAAPGGTFSDASVAAPSFTCTAAGAVVLTLSVSDGSCTESASTTVTCSPAAVLGVSATVETDPIPGVGDAADDPAVWVNPIDPALSTIIGTDKTAGGGLAVYGLDGHQVQFLAAGALNNVDLRDGFQLGGQSVTLVTAGNRTNNSIAIFKIDPATRQLSNVAARTITTLATYGSCMYHSPITGKFYYFVDSKAGDIEQWELFDDGAGHVDATKVRNLHKLGTQPEACVVDDELGFFYIGEEDVGIWKYGAEPTTDPASPLGLGVSVDTTGPGGHLVADVEGLAIARTGAGTGYLIASNQGDSTYPMYTREGANTYVKTFRVGASACGIDEVTGSDGIEVTTAALGSAFPQGVFVTQDDTNPSGNQNFKLVPWQDILNGPGVAPLCAGTDGGAMSSDAGSDTGVVDGGVASSDAGSEAGPVGNPAAFCATYCGKCSTCWNPAGGFSEGDCLYQLSKPNFSVDDCMAGCALGLTPGFPIANLPANWETLACLDFDAAI